MRILHCIDTLDPRRGGPPAYVREAARVLAGAGLEARIATTNGVADPAAQTQTWPALRDALQACDLAHLHGFFAPYIVRTAELCRAAGRPFLISPHGQLDTWCLRQGRARKWLYLRSVGARPRRQAAGWVAATEFEARQIRAVVPATTVFVAEPTVATAAPSPAPPSPSSELRLVFLGRLDPIKRPELVLDAVALMRRQGMAVRLRVIGDGAAGYVRRLRDRAFRAGLQAHVEFDGFLSGAAKSAALAGSDALVLPSAHENFGLAAAEAMASGVPVILSSGVGIADDAQAAGAGFRLDPTTAATIAAAAARLADPLDRARMGAAARAFAAQRYSPGRFAAALVQAYRRVLDDAR